MNPTIQSGVTDFDPGSASFGMYSQWPVFPGRTVYSENALNTFDATTQKHIVFPLRDIAGTVVPNAYIVGVEEAANNDFQDLVYIIRNVSPFVPGLPGDFNANNAVDAGDYVLWRKNLGQPIALPNENVTPGMVTQGDYDTWRANFGAASSGGGQSLSFSNATAPLMAPVSQPTDQREAVRTAFESLDQQASAVSAKRSLLYLFSDKSTQVGRDVAPAPITAIRSQPTEVETTRGLEDYYSMLQRRGNNRLHDAGDFPVGVHDIAFDEAHCEFAAELCSTLLLQLTT